jgi:DNA-directed RNA polymerase subunit RPC12/RpoP
MHENQEYLKCPFCENRYIEAESGRHKCFECGSEFDIDDRLECFFANTEKLRLPAKGIVCPWCGLIQNEDVTTCLYCGRWVNSNVQ